MARIDDNTRALHAAALRLAHLAATPGPDVDAAVAQVKALAAQAGVDVGAVVAGAPSPQLQQQLAKVLGVTRSPTEETTLPGRRLGLVELRVEQSRTGAVEPWWSGLDGAVPASGVVNGAAGVDRDALLRALRSLA